nr:hypothetical protein [Parachlamydiaceae bacterium]
ALKKTLLFANQLVVDLQNKQITFEALFLDSEAIIRNFFYNNYFKNNDFALTSFGLADLIIDHNFLPKDNVGRTIFLHHGLIVPGIDPIQELINIIQTKDLSFEEILKAKMLPKITPKADFRGGLPSIVLRAGKRLSIASKVDERAWASCISNIGIDYDVCDPRLEEELFYLTNDSDRLTFLKSKWENHHFKDRITQVALGFNAMLSLNENAGHSAKSQVWWEEIMRWDNSIFTELKSPFFNELKGILDSKAVSFSMCRDFLLMFGCLRLVSPQSKEVSALTVRLSNPEAEWHKINISQKVNNINYAISIPLDLNRALETLFKMNDSQLDSLRNTFKSFYFNSPYKKDLIPLGIFNEKLADQALKCFKHSHKVIRNLGYELLLLYALSKPEAWVLKNLIRYLPLICDDQITIANLEMVLKDFPNDMVTQKLIYPLISFCQANKVKSKSGLYEFCLALASTDQSSIAINLYSDFGLTVNQQIKFINALLSTEPLEAAKLFFSMQNSSQIHEKDEINLFVSIANAIKKNHPKGTYTLQLLAITSCAKKLFRKQRMETMLNPTLDPIIKIVESLISFNLIPEALDLLIACSAQQIILVDKNQDTEVWLNVCEAALKYEKIDIKYLQEKWENRCSVTINDQKLAVRKANLEIKFRKLLYEKYRNALMLLQEMPFKSGQQDCVEKNNHQIEGCIGDIVKLLDCPELLECSFNFLSTMSLTKKAPSQACIDLAVYVTLECANSCLKDTDKLQRLDEAVKCDLDALKDPSKEYKIRKASLKIGEALLAQKFPHEAKKWLQRIFKIVTPLFISSIESKTEIFYPQSTCFSLLSLELPPKTMGSLENLLKMTNQELDFFKKLIDQLPQTTSNDFRLSEDERVMLLNQAKNCLKHSHSIVKRIGFELLMVCTIKNGVKGE